MDCTRYQAWLIDEAAGELHGARRRRRLEEHLALCSSCRAALERQKRLLAVIESSLVESLRAEPSAEFAARVRVRLAEAKPAASSASGRWMVAAGLVAAAVALSVSGWLGYRARALRRAKSGGAVVGVARPQPPILSRIPKPRETGATQDRESLGAPSTVARASRRPRAPGIAPGIRLVPARQEQGEQARYTRGRAPEPEALVRKDEWVRVVQLYQAVWSGPDRGQILASSASAADDLAAGAAARSIVIKQISIAGLEGEAGAPAAGEPRPANAREVRK